MSFVRYVHRLPGKIQRMFPYWREKPLLVNILIRTSRRPNYFRTCMESVYSQTYPNIRAIVSYDNDESFDYVSTYRGIETIRVYPAPEPYAPLPADYPYDYYKLHPNLYLNTLMDLVTDGFVLYLDDDDKLMHPDCLETIVRHITSADDLVFWKVQFPGRYLPEDKFFGMKPVYSHIDTCGFTFHAKYIPQTRWEGWSGGDYRVVSGLYDRVPNKIFIDEILTGIQRDNRGGGMGKQTDKPG